MEKNIPTAGSGTAQNSRTAGREDAALTMIYEALGSARWTVYTKQDGSVDHVRWSDELRRLLGYQDTDEMPDTMQVVYDLVHPDDFPHAFAHFTTALAHEGERYDIEFRLRAKDGGYHWFRAAGKYAPVLKDGLRAFYGILLSIDRQKRYEEEIRRQRDDLAAANMRYHDQMKVIGGMGVQYGTVWLIHVPEMTLTLYQNTGDRVVQAAVDEGERINSYEEALAGYAKLYVYEEDREQFLRDVSYAVVREQIRKKSVYRVNYRRFMHDKLEYYQISFARTVSANHTEDFVAGFKNVDDEVKEERQRQAAMEAALAAAEKANESKTVFLNNISHDIRTPMNGIIGMTAIAGAHLDDRERVKECLGKITAASGHLLSLINDVLDVSRIESGKVSLAEEEFSLSDQFDSMVNMIAPQIKAKKQELSVEIGHVIHEDVIGDPLRLQQVFMNIVGNAIKYTQDGGHISVCLKEDTESSDNYSKYIFICEDNGFGMKQEFLSRLFLPFERAQDERTRSIPGTGLGMVIARNIVRMLDGDIEVETEYGKGSKFTVTFRLKRQEIAQEKSTALRGVPVLVVDDDASTCESACMVLDEMGMRSAYALSGQEAIKKVTAAHKAGRDYHVCLIDWKMPDMDGIEVTERIREIVGGEVPIVIISAYDWSEIEMPARAAGADAFISKPLFRSRLDVTLRDVVAGEKPKSGGNVLNEYVEKDYSDKRILLVEDNELNREISVEILGMTGAQIETAEDGRQALACFESHAPGYYDLIFMDIQMPVMDGLQATRAIRQLRRADALTIPIVAMSANAFTEDMESSKRAGMNDHISKPVSLPKLLGVMENYLGTRSAAFVRPEQSKVSSHTVTFAKYYERLYFMTGTTEIPEEAEELCIEVLNHNGAVGIFGLLEEKDYPIYFVSEFALRPLGYTYEEFMKATDGHFIELIYEDDRKRFMSEFYDTGRRHCCRVVAKSGEVMLATTYMGESCRVDGRKTRIMSLRVEGGSTSSRRYGLER